MQVRVERPQKVASFLQNTDMKTESKLKYWINEYRTDPELKSRVRLYSGALLNAIFAVFKIATGIIYRSAWLLAAGIYFLIFLAVRMHVINLDLRVLKGGADPDHEKEWSFYGKIGWLMFLMDLGLSGIVVQVVKNNEANTYPGIVIYIIALYAFYRYITAVIRIIKGRDEERVYLSAARSIDMSFAVTEIFTLQVAMLSQFGQGQDFRTMNIITGTGVALIVAAIAIDMIVRSRRHRRC